MRFTKKGIMKAAALGSVLVGTLAVAAPASANSLVFYNDENDQFCVANMTFGLASDGIPVTIAPEQSDQGPTHHLYVRGHESKCVSLATAYEDSSYYYQMANTFGAWGERVYFHS